MLYAPCWFHLPYLTTATWTPQTNDIGGVLVPYAPWFRCFSPTLDEQIASNRTEVR